MNRLNKGILIALEGIDGAGKTTQVMKLKNYYQGLGFRVSVFKEPTDGYYGKQIRKLAKSGRNVSPQEEFELFLRDRIEDCELNIVPALKRKELIFIDRYYFSSIAYQGALGLDIDYIWKKNEEIAVVPDLVIILDVAVKIGLSRIIFSRKEKPNYFEKEEYQQKVREIFKQLKASYIQEIDASFDVNTVFNNIKNITNSIIEPYVVRSFDVSNKVKEDILLKNS